MKKKVLYAFTMMMSMGLLVGCGTPKASTLIKDMQNAELCSARIVTAFNMDIESDGDDDISSTIQMDIVTEVSGLDDADNMAAGMTGSIEYDLIDGSFSDEADIEAYLVGDDGDYTYYFNDDDDWYYLEGELEDLSYSYIDLELSPDMIEDMSDIALSLLDEASVEKKTKKIGGVPCYVVKATPSGEDWCSFFGDIAESFDEEDDFDEMLEDIEDEYDTSLEEIMDSANISVELYITKKNHEFAGFCVDMSELDIEGMLDCMDMDMDDLADELDMDIEEIVINELSFTMTLEDINNVTVEVPKKVKKNATEYENKAGYGNDALIVDGLDLGNNDNIDTVDTKNGTFMLLNYAGDEIYTFHIPFGYGLGYISDTSTYYELKDNNFNYIYVSVYGSDSVTSFIKEGQMPSAEWYPDFDCEYKEYNNKGVTYYIARYEYNMGDGWGMYEAMCILVPYVDEYGFDQCAEISLPYNYPSLYSIDDKQVISLANEMLGLD